MSPSPQNKKKSTYAAAGVDITAGDEFVKYIQSKLPHVGSFSGAFPFPLKKYNDPLLVASNDGVGTKLVIAALADDYSSIGFDLVGMVANDLITCGAQPLFFLDYLGTNQLNSVRSRTILDSIIEACEKADMTLLGGETAEMPGFYQGEHIELSGFGVGVVEKSKIIDGQQIQPGDNIIGIPSNGLHSNGFSLVRKIVFDRKNLPAILGKKLTPPDSVRISRDEERKKILNSRPKALGDKSTLQQELLRPTEIYVPLVNTLLKKRIPVRGIAHITGGGIAGNLVRVLPEHTTAEIERGSWFIPPIFPWLASLGNVPEEEMYRVFNMGIGLILVIPVKSTRRCLSLVQELYPTASIIGTIQPGVNPTRGQTLS